MQPILNIGMWVSLSPEVRNKIRSVFNIPRSGNVIVNDGRIETDGTTFDDFKVLTIQKMQEYVGDTSTDFHKLFDKVVDKVRNELNPVGKVEVVPPIVAPMAPVIPKKRGRPYAQKK